MEIEDETKNHNPPEGSDFGPMSQDRAEGCLLGMGVGDALGAPFEFEAVKKIDLQRDLTTRLPMKPTLSRFRLKAGQWTDDTSQGLCLAEAFVERAKQFKLGFDPKRFMNLIVGWWTRGHNSGLDGRAVGLGRVVSKSLTKWRQDPTGDDPIQSAFTATFPDGKRKPSYCDGNGSTMRCAAPAVFASSLDEAMFFAYQQSLVTTPGLQSAACAALMAYLSYQAIHASETDANQLKAKLLSPKNLQHFLEKLLALNAKFHPEYQITENSEDYQLIEALCKGSSTSSIKKEHISTITDKKNNKKETTCTSEKPIYPQDAEYTTLKAELKKTDRKVLFKDQVTIEDNETKKYTTTKYTLVSTDYLNWRQSHQAYELDGPTHNTGYYGSYVMSGMALALHVLNSTNSFDEAVQMAALMQGDADSNAAVVGILAGAIYGRSAIHKPWLDSINQYPLNQGSDVTIIPFVENAVNFLYYVPDEAIQKLEAYIQRIDTYQGDYAHGFWFFAESRAINRERNYELAKTLLEKLKNQDNHVVSIFSDLEAKRNTFATTKTLPWYGLKGIHSADLNEIIEMMQTRENPQHQKTFKKSII